jgi:hypothetical protein
MSEMEMTPAQVQVIAAWSEHGEDFVPLVLHAVSRLTNACRRPIRAREIT